MNTEIWDWIRTIYCHILVYMSHPVRTCHPITIKVIEKMCNKRSTLIFILPFLFHIQNCHKESISGLGFEKHITANHPQFQGMHGVREREGESKREACTSNTSLDYIELYLATSSQGGQGVCRVHVHYSSKWFHHSKPSQSTLPDGCLSSRFCRVIATAKERG